MIMMVMIIMMMLMMVAMIMIVNDHGANAPEIETRYATKGEKAARRDGREHTTKHFIQTSSVLRGSSVGWAAIA